MSPDDPRHGTYAGYARHLKTGTEMCPPCGRVGSQRRKRNKYLEHAGRPGYVPAFRLLRRVHALQALGWPIAEIARRADVPAKTLRSPQHRGTYVLRATFDAVDTVYEELSMRPAPDGGYYLRTRKFAASRRYAPPFAWDDIDDPDETPKGYLGLNRQRRGDVPDEAVVIRVLEGEYHLPATPIERVEICRRWVAAGGALLDLERRTGWRAIRYYRIGEAA